MDRSAGYTTITPGPIHLLLRRDRRPEDLDKTPAGPGFASLSPRRLACGKNNVGNSLSIFRVCIGDFSLLGFRRSDARPFPRAARRRNRAAKAGVASAPGRDGSKPGTLLGPARLSHRLA